MSNRVSLEPAYVLHTRLMSETSLLVDCLTLGHGRLSFVAKGARRPKSALAGLLQPFNPLLISFLGASDLKTLTQAEPHGPFCFLKGDRLACGLYMNELCVRLLPPQVPVPELFDCYAETITALNTDHPPAPMLRIFEKQLLSSVGVDLCLHQDADQQPIEPEAHYLYDPTNGPYRVNPQQGMGSTILGKSLLGFASGDLSSSQTCSQIKPILQALIKNLLGEKPIVSRQLFQNK